MGKRCVYSALRTPDGTIIQSKHRHDYVTYTDANGNEYMLDGGLDYRKTSANGDEEDVSVYLEDGHERVREFVAWGTYGKNGDEPLAYVTLKDMETDHIWSCLPYAGTNFRIAMLDELKFRGETL